VSFFARLCAFLAALTAVVGHARGALAQSEAQCVVGVIAPLSGAAAPYGIALQRSAVLVREDHGLRSTLLFEDNQSSALKAVTAFEAFARRKPLAVVVIDSGSANAVAPLAERARIPLVAVASDARVSAGRRYVLRAWASGEEEGGALAAEAKERGYSRPLFIHSIDEYALTVSRGFRTRFGPAAVVAEVPPGSTDVRALLLRLGGSNPEYDAVGLCLRAGQVGGVARELRALGWRQPIFGCVTLENEAEAGVAGGALAGAWYVSAAVQREFRARYARRFADATFIGGAAVVYDVLRRIDTACRSGALGAKVLEVVGGATFPPQAVERFEVGEGAGPRELSPRLGVLQMQR